MSDYAIHWTRVPVSKLTFKRFATTLRIVAGMQEVGDYTQDGVFLITHGPSDQFLCYPQEEGLRSCRTGRVQPYTTAVMKACILLVEYCAATNVSDDDRNWQAWLNALEEVNTTSPLRTYAYQKRYFQEFLAASQQLSAPAQELLVQIHGLQEENLALRCRVRELEGLNNTLLQAVQSPEDAGAMRRLSVALAGRVLTLSGAQN